MVPGWSNDALDAVHWMAVVPGCPLPASAAVGREQADVPAARMSPGLGRGRSARDPSPPCSRQQSRARRAAAQRSAWPYAAAWPARSGPLRGSRRSPARVRPTWASRSAASACSRVAARTGTSSAPSPSSDRTPAPPHGGCGPQQTRNVERRRRPPRQTSPADPKKGQPNRWPDFTPPASAPSCRSIGLVCHRPAQAGRRRPAIGSGVSDDLMPRLRWQPWLAETGASRALASAGAVYVARGKAEGGFALYVGGGRGAPPGPAGSRRVLRAPPWSYGPQHGDVAQQCSAG